MIGSVYERILDRSGVNINTYKKDDTKAGLGTVSQKAVNQDSWLPLLSGSLLQVLQTLLI